MRKTSLLKVALFLAALGANINYLFFLFNPAHADNPGFYLLTCLADGIALLIFSSTWATALYFECSKPRYYREIAELRKAGKALLSQRVAILIPVVHEDLAIVRNTVLCAQRVRGHTTIYLLDDGKRTATAELAQELGVHYVTRPTNELFKAGNLAYALAHVVTEPYVAVVDADFALASQFLEKTLPLFIDPRIGAVQTPQVYANSDTFFARGCQHLQDLFYTYLQPGKHLLGSAFIVGTNVIYRRSALDACGGIAQVADSEDLFTTLHLMEHNYTVFFLDEPLASGLGPTTLIAFCNQQHRWARGGLRMLLKHSTLFNRALSGEQRIQFFLSNCFYLSGVSLFLSLINPFLAILLNSKPIADGSTLAWTTAYLPFLVLNFGTSFLLMKRYRGQALVLGMLSFAPYLSALRATLIGRAFQWKITNQASKGLITRLLAPHIIYLTLALTMGVFLFTGAIPYDPSLRLYYGWLAFDAFLLLLCIFAGYSAPSKVSIPAFAAQPLDIHTAEMLLVTVPSQKLPFPVYPPIEEIPTLRLNGVQKEQ